MKSLSLEGFVGELARLTAEMALAETVALTKAAHVVQAEAKASMGHYQDQAGEFAAWAELATSTKDDRVRQGYPENEPELRSGDLRDTIEITVLPHEAHIGSDDDVMVFQELGTEHMPARSILGGAAFRKGPEVAKEIGGDVVATLIGEQVAEKALPIPL